MTVSSEEPSQRCLFAQAGATGGATGDADLMAMFTSHPCIESLTWCCPYDLLLLPVRTSQHGRDVGPVEEIAGYHPGRVILIGRQPASGTTVKVGFWPSSKAIKITPNIAPGVGMYVCTENDGPARRLACSNSYVCVLRRGSNHVPAEWHIDGLRHLREGNQEFLTVASRSLLRIMSSRAITHV